MPYVLKSEVFIRRGVSGRGGGELGPLFLNFQDRLWPVLNTGKITALKFELRYTMAVNVQLIKVT